MEGFADLLNKLSEQGLLGLLLALSLGANVFLYRENRREGKERLVESKADTQKMMEALFVATRAQETGTTAMGQLKAVVETAMLRGRR